MREVLPTRSAAMELADERKLMRQGYEFLDEKRMLLATEMLRRGASLTEIGEILRHRSPETTTIYAKVDLDALRTLALPWPRGGR
jgi:vacuolar-type H+-ATPase subunit D/Vma8